MNSNLKRAIEFMYNFSVVFYFDYAYFRIGKFAENIKK